MSTAAQNLKIRRLTSKRAKGAAIPFAPEKIFLDKHVENHPQAIRILNRLRDVEVDVVDDVACIRRLSDLSQAKGHLILTEHKGQAFKPCQGMIGGQLCCNMKTIDLVSGCPMDCSYCVLQSYLANNPTTTAYVNIEGILAEISEFLSSHSSRFYRICTGELSDSLALDPMLEFASILIPFFSTKRNAMLELKTKTTLVDHLLDLRHRNRTVISWSVNTPAMIASEERGTATLEERFVAARKAADAGFGIGFHFDPIIIVSDFDAEIDGYLKVAGEILCRFEPREISWISLGTLRYPKDLPPIATKRFKSTRIFAGEVVPSGGKMRYLRFLRERVYKAMWQRLTSKIPTHKVYLCMETDAVWEKVDPSVKSNSCIEKRVCNMENIAFDYSS
jgi:spore photoproduct lyase